MKITSSTVGRLAMMLDKGWFIDVTDDLKGNQAIVITSPGCSTTLVYGAAHNAAVRMRKAARDA